MKSRTSQLPVVLSAAFAVASFPALAGARPAPGGVAAPSYYQRALNRFHQDDCAGALELLNHAPAGSGVEARTRADLLNLRGEIHLKQGQLEFARKEFAQAVALNPQLWSGRFNLAEVALRRRRYADSQRQFASLVEHTSRFDHAEERSRAEAGLRLATAGDSQSQPELGGSATMAVMQLLPAQKLATHHAETATPSHPGVVQSAHRPPAPSVNPVLASQSAPPSPSLAPAEDETDDIAPGLLARKRPAPKPRPTPQPADQSSPPSDSATPSPASAAASSATPAPSATPSPDPATPAFLQKYESAYIKFLEKDFAGAQAILTEADAIQANQPASIDLRNKIFSYYYKIAYGKYSDKDYTGAQTALDDADSVEKDQPDSLNLRGLIFSRQRVFDQAEVMFKKAVQADPSFWAAKFNMAELPFTYRNYTVARARYEQLLSETNASKQPREAELTQFKVFLTLLLEGKESAARAFMDHFSFTGATPARYYCQAALDFYAGNTDKATESIAEARKDFPAQIEAIFADSFYRVGWLTDPTRPALASASSSPAEAPEPPVSPSPSLAGSSPSRGPATAAVKSPSPTPMLMAAASPSPTPVVSASPSPKQAAVATIAPTSTPSPVPTATAKPTATPAPTATATPAPTATARPTATATPAPTATPTATVKPTATATATPAPTATPTATVKPTATATPAPTATVKPTVTPTPAPTATVKPTVTATPAPTPTVRPTLAATATPSPSATATPSPTATAKPASVAALTPTPTLRPSASPTPTPAAAAAVTQEPSPSESESPAETPEAENSPQEDLIRLFAMLLVPLYLIGSWFYVVRRALAIKAEKRKPALHYGGRKQSSDDSDTPR